MSSTLISRRRAVAAVGLGFEDVVAGGWYGLFMPKSTPTDVVARFEKAVGKAMRSSALTKFLVEQDLGPAYQNARDFGVFHQEEMARWRAAAARTNFKAEE